MAGPVQPLAPKPAAILVAQILLWIQAVWILGTLAILDLALVLFGLLGAADTWDTSKGPFGLMVLVLAVLSLVIATTFVIAAALSGHRQPRVLFWLIGLEAFLVVVQVGAIAWLMANETAAFKASSPSAAAAAPGTLIGFALPIGIIALLIAGRRYYATREPAPNWSAAG